MLQIDINVIVGGEESVVEVLSIHLSVGPVVDPCLDPGLSLSATSTQLQQPEVNKRRTNAEKHQVTTQQQKTLKARR